MAMAPTALPILLGFAAALLADGPSQAMAANSEHPVRLAETGGGLIERQVKLAASHINAGDALRDQSKLAEALKRYRSAQAIFDGLLKFDGANFDFQEGMAIVLSRIADVLRQRGDLDGMIETLRQAIAMLERMATAEPDELEIQRSIAVRQMLIGDALLDKKAFAESMTALDTARTILERLVARDAANEDWQRFLGMTYERIADVFAAQGEPTRAIDSHRLALAIYERLAKSGAPSWQVAELQVRDRLATLLQSTGARVEAIAMMRTSHALREAMAKAAPKNFDLQWDTLVSHWHLSELGDDPALRLAVIILILSKRKPLTAEQSQLLNNALVRFKQLGGKR